MKDATTLILEAIEASDELRPAGKQSLLAVAARALDPDVQATRDGISNTLGMHPCLAVAALVSADLAGDSDSRRQLGKALFSQIPLSTRVPQLTTVGRLTVAGFCLDRLAPVATNPEAGETDDGPDLGELITLAQAEVARVTDGEEPDLLALKRLENEALTLQRAKVVPMQKGAKSKLGVDDREATRRRAAQVLRAVAAGLKEKAAAGPFVITMAGETVGSLATRQGTEAAIEFCVELAKTLAGLPAGAVVERLPN